MEDERQERQSGEHSLLPALHSITKEQVMLTGGTLVASGVADLVFHGSGTGAFFGFLATFIVARHSKDIMNMLVPGSDADQVVDMTARVVDTLAPTSTAYEDQSVGAKMQRLFGRNMQHAAQPKDEREEERMRPPQHCLDLAPTLQPHVNTFFGSRIGVFGLPGSGKSNTIAVILEELGQFGCPMLVLDTEHENYELGTQDYFENPMREHSGTITPDNAFEWGQAIMEGRLQVILNLQSYKTDDEAALTMIGLCEGMNAWAETQPTRIPCAIVLDEAHKWLPQQPGMSTLSKAKNEDGFTLLDLLKQCFLGTVASRGRKRGLSLLFATQRLALLDKNLIMCEWLFLLRQSLPNDLKTYAEMGCPANIAQMLLNGQAYVISPTKEREAHQMRLRYSESGAKTPGLADLEKYKRSRSLSQFTQAVSRAENPFVNTTIREDVNEPLEPVNGREEPVNIHLDSQALVNAVNANSKVTWEVKEQILQTIIQMQFEGLKINRTALRDRLGWNSRQYEEILKPALDEMGLLK